MSDALTAAYAELHGLCDGSRKFTMSVPVRADRDSDMLISAGLDLVEPLRTQLAAAQASVLALREALRRLHSAAENYQGACSEVGHNFAVEYDTLFHVTEDQRAFVYSLATRSDAGALRAMLRQAFKCGEDMAGDSSM